jgi:hypothetical protein
MKIISYRYLPLNLYVGYSFFVLLCLFIGPIKYKGLDYIVLASFIFVLNMLFFFGYVLGARGDYRQSFKGVSVRLFSFQRIRRLFGFLMIVAVTSSVIKWYSALSAGIDLSLDNVGGKYVEFYEGYERGKAVVDIFYIMNIFDQALVVLVILLSFYYFEVLGRTGRFAFLFIVMTYLLINVVATGKQKYLGDVVVFALFSIAINFAAKDIKFKASVICIAGMAAVFVFLMFVEILRQRYMAIGIGLDNIYEKVHPLIIWDDTSLVLDLVSENYALAFSMFLMYLTNGLYGLYLSLTLPFEWTYFVGSSYSLGRIVEIVFSSNGAVLEHTYPYRVGIVYGWGFDKWHSLFAWLASDITFFGVLLLAPLFSFLYARLWLQAIMGNNPFAGPLFIYLSLGLIFSYANNQIMHTLAGVIVLFFLLTGWIFSRNLTRQGSRGCDGSKSHGDIK